MKAVETNLDARENEHLKETIVEMRAKMDELLSEREQAVRLAIADVELQASQLESTLQHMRGRLEAAENRRLADIARVELASQNRIDELKESVVVVRQAMQRLKEDYEAKIAAEQSEFDDERRHLQNIIIDLRKLIT